MAPNAITRSRTSRTRATDATNGLRRAAILNANGVALDRVIRGRNLTPSRYMQLRTLIGHIMKLSITGSAILALSGCPKHELVTPKPPPEFDVRAACTVTCMHLASLSCETADDNCVEFCVAVETSGYLELPLECVMAANTRREVLACGVDCYTTL